MLQFSKNHPSKALLAATFLIIATIPCKAQNLSAPVKGINEDHLLIKKSGGSSITFGETETLLLQRLGVPTSSSDFLFEMDEVTGKLHLYGNNEIYIMNEKLEAFSLTTNGILVGIGGNFIKVGDDINKVISMYSQANDFKKSGRYRVQLTLGDRVNEGSFLIIEYDANNKITKIWTYES